MPVTLTLKFLAGRYHATPWGRHVNEGVTEWPPSPWRLLRALVATWKRKCDHLPEAGVRRVLEKLAAPPRFRLPPSRTAHTRHAMPTNKLLRNYKPSEQEKSAGTFQGDPTMVFDTFVVVDRNAMLHVDWPDAALEPDEREALAELARNLTTLGRAESWVEAELTDLSPEWNCVPSESAEAGQQLVSVFCADPTTAFGDEHYPKPPDAKALKKGVPAADRLFDCPRWHLCLDTEIVHERRWPNVPGSKWVSYLHREAAAAPPPKAKGRHARTVARFALDGPVLPLVTEALAVADAFRGKLLGRYSGVVKRLREIPDGSTAETHPELRSRTLSGKEDGEKVTGSHGHAYYLPTDEDGDGRIDHVTVVATAGFGDDEIAALDGFRKMGVGELELKLLLVGLGCPGNFRSRLFDEARVWESATPFLVTRHAKKNGTKRDPAEFFGIDGRPLFVRAVLEEELARWLRDRPGVEMPEIEELPRIETAAGQRTRSLAYRRARPSRKGSDDGFRRPFGAYRLTFSQDVRGPICLGHSAHFGLGMFLGAAGAL